MAKREMKMWFRWSYACALLLFVCSACADEEGQKAVEGNPSELIAEDSSQGLNLDATAPDERVESGDVSGGGEEPLCVPEDEVSPTWYGGVAKILYENCTVCHADIPQYGAPMSLESYASATGPGWLNESESMPDAILRVIQDGSMPPVSQAPLQPQEIIDLEAWAKNCSPEGDEAEINVEEPTEVQVPPPPTDTLVLAIEAGGYEVPLQDDKYMCFPATLEFEGDKQIVRFDYDLDATEVIHHLVLYADPDKEAGTEPFGCGGVALDHSLFMYAWAPGATPLQFPEGMGFPVKNGDSVLLQIHYNNSQKLENIVDSSRIEIHLADAQPQEVGMFAPGPLAFSIEPFTEKSVESTCLIQEPIQILSSSPHMHEVGAGFLQEIHRVDGTVETLVKLDKWDFNEQFIYNTAVQLNPGDKLLTRCDYENNTASTVVSGQDTGDEMCFNFMYHSPPLSKLFCEGGDSGVPDISPVLGDCTSDSDLQLAATVEGEGFLGLSDSVVGDEALPNGDWVLTELRLPLGDGEIAGFTLDVDQSSVHTRTSLRVADSVFSLDMNTALSLVAVAGTALDQEFHYSMVSEMAYDEDIQGHVSTEMSCEDGPFEFVFIRLKKVEETLVGQLVFSSEFVGGDVYYDVVLGKIPGADE